MTDYYYEQRKDEREDRIYKRVYALVNDHHTSTMSHLYANFIVSQYDTEDMNDYEVVALADDLFICEQCENVETIDNRSEVEQDIDLCVWCGGSK